MTLADKLLYRQGTCPWWVCFTFDNPIRRILQNPENILQGLVKEGQIVYDIGCGMGYFSLTLARMVGKEGTVICVDLQKEMLSAARRRAERAGLADRIRLKQCSTQSLELDAIADFALAFWMVHEVPDKQRFLSEINRALKPGGTLLLVEPTILNHVTGQGFNATVSTARSVGFQVAGEPDVRFSMAVLLRVATPS
jgi:ubiquinone/menaquinone biosynthesis C-methylase UbiE